MSETATESTTVVALTGKPASSPEVPTMPQLLATYKRMLTYQFCETVALVAILALGTLLSYFAASFKLPSLLVLVISSGMLGALFSALTRLYNVDQLSAALISPTLAELDGRYLLMYTLVPPIIGAIGAVVLYIGFVSGLIESGIFPTMSCKAESHACNTLIEIVEHYGPTEAHDYGKVLFWAFIAGFSERFVPDILQSFVTTSQKTDARR